MATYRVLALDGGGIRGLLTAIVLRRLCASVPGWLDNIDLVAGTSSGGMIALALAHGLGEATTEETLDKTVRVFEAGRETFGPGVPWWLGGTLLWAKYGTRSRATRLHGLFGDDNLGTLRRHVLIAAFDLDNEGKNNDRLPEPRCWKPKLFHNFPGINDDRREPVWKVALYTTAAPTYFPTVDGYIDGGVYSNNPSMCALAQMFDCRYSLGAPPALDEIVLLSVGAGLNLNSIEGKTHNWGIFRWGVKFVKLTLDGTVGIADYQCGRLLGDDNYRRIQPVFDPATEIALDDFSQIPRLKAFANAFCNSADFTKHVDWLKEHWVSEPTVRRVASPAYARHRESGGPMAMNNAAPEENRSTDPAELIAQAFIAKVKARKVKEALAQMPRGAHPRHHGLVTADFIVSDNVPKDLKHGILQVPALYPAFIRFSNAGTDPHDGDRDARGIAIKVLGVTGERVEWPEAEDFEGVQDFLLTNFPAFIAKSPEDFFEFMQGRAALAQAAASGAPPPQLMAMKSQFDNRFPNVEAARAVLRSPLTVRYFSQTPYALGEQTFAVKYCVDPRERDREGPLSEPDAKKLSKHYLRDAMAARLAAGNSEPVVFEFKLQRRLEGMDIEDPTRVWSEEESSFETVATIVIRPQDFQTTERMTQAENISFNPWNSLQAHIPLGRVNMARRVVYPRSVAFRHAENGVATPIKLVE